MVELSLSIDCKARVALRCALILSSIRSSAFVAFDEQGVVGRAPALAPNILVLAMLAASLAEATESTSFFGCEMHELISDASGTVPRATLRARAMAPQLA